MNNNFNGFENKSGQENHEVLEQVKIFDEKAGEVSEDLKNADLEKLTDDKKEIIGDKLLNIISVLAVIGGGALSIYEVNNWDSASVSQFLDGFLKNGLSGYFAGASIMLTGVTGLIANNYKTVVEMVSDVLEAKNNFIKA